MGRKASTALYDLIHSLTPTQQRYYSLSFKGEKENLLHRLYSEIQAQKTFDDDKIYEAVSKDYPNRLDYNVKKTQLYASILKAMRQYNSANSSIESKLRNDIEDINFLRDQSLASQALSLATRAKEEAEEHEKYNEALEISKLHASLEVFVNAKTQKEILHIYTKYELEGKELAEKISSQVALDTIYERLRYWDRGDKPFRDAVKDRVKELEMLLKAKVFRGNTENGSYYAKFVRFEILQEIYRLRNINARKNEYRERYERYRAFLQETSKLKKIHVLESHTGKYISFLYDYLSTAIKTVNLGFDRFEEALDMFEKPQFTHEKVNQIKNFVAVMGSLKLSYFSVDKYLFISILKKYEIWLKKDLLKIDRDWRVQAYYFLGLNYFLFEDYKTSETYLKLALELFEFADENTKPVISQASLILILVAFETGNKANLKNYIFQVGKFIGFQIKEERLITSAVTNFGVFYEHVKDKDEERDLLRRTYHSIDLPKDPLGELVEKRLHSNFDFITWFEAKSSGKPFSKILKGYAGKRNIDIDLFK